MGGRGWREVAVSYYVQEGKLTVTKHHGCGPSVAWTKTFWLSPYQEAQPQNLAPSGNQP